MEDKRRILKMVEDGKITAEEAMKLLEVLDIDDKVSDDDFFNIPKTVKDDKKSGKMLYVRVKSSDKSKVKVNIPVDFIKIMGGVRNMYSSQLEKYNVDIEKLIEVIDNGFIGKIVEVDTEEGDKVIIEIA